MGIARYIEYIGTNKKWIYPQIQMKVKFAANLQMNVWSYPQKQPFPLPFSKQQEPARERMTSVSMYLSGNKIVFILYVVIVIVLCILYLSQVSPGSWQLQFLHGLSWGWPSGWWRCRRCRRWRRGFLVDLHDLRGEKILACVTAAN